MKPNSLGIEFCLLRLYTNPNGFRLALCEIENFDTLKDWSLFAICWSRKQGITITFSQAYDQSQ